MKGPSGRIRYRVNRGWRCAICGRERFTTGAVVTLRCDRCAAELPPRDTWMQLVEAVPVSKPAPPPQEAPANAEPLRAGEPADH